jgi:hypothetical protein
MIVTKKCLMLSAATILLTGHSFAQAGAPTDVYVPDQKTAIRIAEAVLPPICGCVSRNRPFTADLKDGVWTVEGKRPKGKIVFGGGQVYMRIDQRTGAIISHYFER